MGRSFFRPDFPAVLFSVILIGVIGAADCAAQAPQSTATAKNPQRIYVVLPFENAGASPRLDWLGEGPEELTTPRLSAAGGPVYSHAGRASELETYGLPPTPKFRRGTNLRLAEA